MTDMSAVDEAAFWADMLVRREHRGPGDTIDAARMRAARKHRIPEQSLWALRYRKPKTLLADVYRALMKAYDAECARQEARLAHELEMAKALQATPARLALIAETEALLGSLDSAKAGEVAEPAETQGRGQGR